VSVAVGGVLGAHSPDQRALAAQHLPVGSVALYNDGTARSPSDTWCCGPAGSGPIPPVTRGGAGHDGIRQPSSNRCDSFDVSSVLPGDLTAGALTVDQPLSSLTAAVDRFPRFPGGVQTRVLRLTNNVLRVMARRYHAARGAVFVACDHSVVGSTPRPSESL